MLIARIDALAAQVHAVGAGTGADPALAAKIEELAAKVNTAAPGTDPGLAAKIAELTARVETAAQPDPTLLARLDQLSARVDGTPDAARIVELEARLGELAAGAGQSTGTDGAVLARLEELTEKVAAVDVLGSQLATLNARVAAQAEFGAQLGSLRDRISELTNDTDDRRVAALAATDEAELRDRVNAIADRLAATDGLAAQIAQLAERVAANDSTTRQATEQVSAVEQRLNAVSTELANQVSELGRDIDGLAAHSSEVGNGTVSDEVIDTLKSAQVKLAAEQARYEIAFRQDLAELAEQVRRSPKP
jgi:chromosome segregation ATPase